MRFWTSIIVFALQAGCTDVDPLPITDAQGNAIRLPAAWDTWLEMEEITPGESEIPEAPIFRIRFTTYLQTTAFFDVDMVSLTSGGLRASGRATYDIVDRTLEWSPFSPLVTGLEYTLTLNGDRIQSITGAPLLSKRLPTYAVRKDVFEHDPEPKVFANWDDVAHIFEVKCWGCHHDPQWQLNPLTPESMIGVNADATDVFLVKPRDPASSYLMHKILPDYPLRRFGVQPPTWSSEEPLTYDELKVIQGWIQAGAP